MSRAASVVSVVSLALLACGAVVFTAATRVGSWEALPLAVVALILLGLALLLSPVALALHASGRGALSRLALAIHLVLCAFGAALGLAIAFTGPPGAPVARGLGALVAGLDGWGVLLAVRIWRR